MRSHHYATDPDRGGRNGLLTPNTQVNIGGNRLWCAPTFRPGEALPDPFGPDSFSNVRGWKRENDPLYVESLYRPTLQAPPPPAPPKNMSGAGPALFPCLCLGVR